MGRVVGRGRDLGERDARTGEPLTAITPCTISRSWGAASSMWPAICRTFSRNRAAEIRATPPPITALRLPAVPPP